MAAFCFTRLRVFEVARVLVRLNHIARQIINAQKKPNSPMKIGNDPNGIRTRVTAVKGRCPRPLDDRVKKPCNIGIAGFGARQIGSEVSIA